MGAVGTPTPQIRGLVIRLSSIIGLSLLLMSPPPHLRPRQRLRYIPSRQASLSSLPSMGARTAQASAFGYQPPSPQAALHPHRQSPSSLFDSSRPQFPNPSLMPQLIQLFFQELGGNFLFLSLEDTLRDQWDRSLPPLLSNCIAAMGARCVFTPRYCRHDLNVDVQIHNSARVGGTRVGQCRRSFRRQCQSELIWVSGYNVSPISHDDR